MPYQSDRQRAYMHIHLPKIAARWDKKYGKKVNRKAVKRALDKHNSRRKGYASR